MEIKSAPRRLTGDQQRWTFHWPDGGRTTLENPAVLHAAAGRRLTYAELTGKV